MANGVVYVGLGKGWPQWDGKLHAFNAATGVQLWSSTTGNSYIYSSPAVANGVVYVGSCRDYPNWDSKLSAFGLNP